jgi:DNA-binding GntR family transcriptional regulator
MQDKQCAEHLYLQIKQDIRGQNFPIGEALKQVELSRRYGVSRIPIRDALQKLKSEGWLTVCGKRGVMVPPLSAEEAEDLYMMRMYLEPLLLGHGLPRINNQCLGQAEDVLEQIDNGQSLSIEQHGELNWQFHSILYQAANRPTLFNNVAGLHQQCGRYIGYHTLELNYLKTSQDEHRQLLESIKAKNLTKAKQILKAHIAETGEKLVDHLLKGLHF